MALRLSVAVRTMLTSALVLLAACGQPSPAVAPTAPPGARTTPTIATPPGLNPVALGGLTSATRINVLAFDSSPGGGGQPGYVQRLAITDPATVQQVLAILNADLKPLPKAACIPDYELRFQLAGGAMQTMTYSCPGTSFLRGDQPGWGENDAQAPAAFDRLMQDLLAAPVPKP